VLCLNNVCSRHYVAITKLKKKASYREGPQIEVTAQPARQIQTLVLIVALDIQAISLPFHRCEYLKIYLGRHPDHSVLESDGYERGNMLDGFIRIGCTLSEHALIVLFHLVEPDPVRTS
jgi:hypothetical protein